MGLKEQILASQDIPSEEVLIPQWGNAKIVVKGLSGYQRDEFERGMIPDDKSNDKTIHLRNTRARLVAMCCYDPATPTTKLFTMEEVGLLGNKSALALTILFKKARELSGMNDDMEDEAKK